jgi:predicted nucleotidyltransferase component of viral defense system
VIAGKFVDLYARNSGLRDKLIAERDVVLTYALRALADAGVMDHLAFKGGTCLRKLVFGTSGRFSEDLDFTIDSSEPDDDVLVRLVEAFNRELYGITFSFNEYYKTEDDTSFGGDVLYRHSWNDAGRFRLQVSLRERPTLPAAARPMQHQAYFDRLEFPAFNVRSLDTIEMIAEKVRAAFQPTCTASRPSPSMASYCARSSCSSSGRSAIPLCPRRSSRSSAVASTTGPIFSASCALRIASSPRSSSPPSSVVSTCFGT